jgi:hypothetical protein
VKFLRDQDLPQAYTGTNAMTAPNRVLGEGKAGTTRKYFGTDGIRGSANSFR